MKNLAQKHLKPSTLRLLLSLSMFAILGLSIGGFIFIQQKMTAFAVEVSHKKVDAAASKASLRTLQRIEKELSDNAIIIEKSKNIKHVSDLPQFKAIEDLRNHAKANGLAISGITFTATNAATGGSAAAPAPAAAPTTDPAAMGTAPTATGADGVDITFKLGDGAIPAGKFIEFLYDIEHSVPKMQIQGIDVAAGTGSDDVTIGNMTVKMFTKSAGQ